MSLHGYEFQSEFARKYVEQGRKKGLCIGIEGLAHVLGIELSAERQELLENAGVERLEELLAVLVSSRQWPADVAAREQPLHEDEPA